MHAHSLSHGWLFATLWTIACQVPLSMKFSRQEYWSGLLFSPPGGLPDPGIKPISLAYSALAGRFFFTVPGRQYIYIYIYTHIHTGGVYHLHTPWLFYICTYMGIYLCLYLSNLLSQLAGCGKLVEEVSETPLSLICLSLEGDKIINMGFMPMPKYVYLNYIFGK